MAQDKDVGPSTEEVGQEEPVREKFKKARIDAPHQDAPMAAAEDQRGRAVSKKRSFEELDAGSEQTTAPQTVRRHSRKRSRGTSEEDDRKDAGHRASGEQKRLAKSEEGNESVEGDQDTHDDTPPTPEQRREKRTEAAVGGLSSPKSKKSKKNGETQPEETADVEYSGDALPTTEAADSKEVAALGEPSKTLPSGSNSASTSAAPPFGAVAGPKPPSSSVHETSASAFAASGFGALSGSSTSGFGAIGKSSGGFGLGGGFATGSKSPTPSLPRQDNEKKSEVAATGTFGGALAQKPAFSSASGASSGFGSGSFGSSTQGFGALGSKSAGFGSTLGTAGGFGSLGGGALTSFASGKPSTTFGAGPKPAKAFGAPAEDEEENEGGEGDDEDGDESGVKSPLSADEDKKDERFYERELATGEEEEKTEYSCRAKLYAFATLEDGKKEWRERGLGIVRLNVKETESTEPDAGDEPASTIKARLVMRAEGSHRVVLNTPVKKEIHFGAPDGGGPPNGGYVFFQGAIDGKAGLQLLQLKMRHQFALELHGHIEDLKQQM